MSNQADVRDLLVKLNNIRPLGGEKSKTSIESISDGIRKWVVLTAAAMFGVLLLLVGVQEFFVELPYVIKWIAMIILVVAILLPMISMLIDVAIGVLQIIRFKSEAFRLLMLEIESDYANVDVVVNFEKNVIEEVRSWLEFKCSRMRAKIGFFFGGSEKVALMSLAGFGWITIDGILNANIPLSLLSIVDSPVQSVKFFGSAFLAGLSIGAVLMNRQLMRYAYHLQLLEMALKRKLDDCGK